MFVKECSRNPRIFEALVIFENIIIKMLNLWHPQNLHASKICAYMVKDLATRDYFLCAQLLQMNCEYCVSLQTGILSITGIQMLMYMCKLGVKSCSCKFFDCLDCEFLNLENFY